MIAMDLIMYGWLVICYLVLGAACATMLSHTQTVKHSRFRNYFIAIGFCCWPLTFVLLFAYGFYYPFEVVYKLLKGDEECH